LIFLKLQEEKMSEHVINNKEKEGFTPGMAFMGFLMATATIGGIFFLPALIIMVVNIVS
jgi:hypothetical protein